MIEIIYGNNRDKCLEILEERITACEKEKYQTSRLSLLDINDQQKIIEEIVGEDLFASKKLLIISGIFESEKIIEILLAHTDSKNTDTYIIIFETDIPKDVIKSFEKKKVPIHHHKHETERDTEIFKLTDAVAGRDIKRAWLVFRQLLDNGMVAHQMIGMLWWQMKTLLLVASTKTNPGLKPFVYTKNKKALEKFTLPEIQEKTLGLLDVYHQGHMGDDIEVLLEQWILK
jgi:DNA polymerase III delta subunit